METQTSYGESLRCFLHPNFACSIRQGQHNIGNSTICLRKCNVSLLSLDAAKSALDDRLKSLAAFLQWAVSWDAVCCRYNNSCTEAQLIQAWAIVVNRYRDSPKESSVVKQADFAEQKSQITHSQYLKSQLIHR